MTLRFACCDVGVTDCRAVIKSESKDELLSKVAKHAEQKHGVKLNETLVSFALSKVTER
jgi:predicted small metal-binding protein